MHWRTGWLRRDAAKSTNARLNSGLPMEVSKCVLDCYLLRRTNCFKEGVACQQPRSHVGKEATAMAYKADEGTLRRLPNINSYPKYFLPFKTTSMTTMPWNPFAVCGIPHGGPASCCGVTKKGQPCKNSIKFQDTKIGHERLTTLAREPFDLSTLQSKLCDIARAFLCARWHRQQQADQVGQRWYEAAIRN